MKSLISLVLVLSLIGCGRGFRTGNFANSETTGHDSVDAYYGEDSPYYIDDNQTEEQLELDLGDKPVEEPPEEQIELPLEPEATPTPSPTPEQKEPREEIKEKPTDIGRAQLLKPTVYYLPSNDVAPFRSCKAEDTKFFKAKKGQTLVSGKTEIKVCSKFYYAVQMQGSGLVRTRDDRQYLLNYVGAEDGLPRFKVIDRDVCPYGLGVSNLCLQPFISIAADRNRTKPGDVIYVPAVAKANIKLPDGDIHQGFFIIADTGAAIVGHGRFDFYTGPMHYSDPKNPFVKLGLQSKLNRAKLTFHQVKRGSSTEKKVQEYYKGRQIIPYR